MQTEHGIKYPVVLCFNAVLYVFVALCDFICLCVNAVNEAFLGMLGTG